MMEILFIPLVGMMIAAMGAAVALTPAEQLLRLDRRTGRAIYEGELKRTSSPVAATRKAAAFYRAFGFAMAAFGLAGFVVGTVLALR